MALSKRDAKQAPKGLLRKWRAFRDNLYVFSELVMNVAHCICQAWVQCCDDARERVCLPVPDTSTFERHARGRVCLPCDRHVHSAEMTRVGGYACHVPGMGTVLR